MFKVSLKILGVTLFTGMGAISGAIAFVNIYEKVTGEAFDKK